MSRGHVLLIRSIVSALASIVNDLPRFTHPYLIKMLKVCLNVYTSSHTRGTGLSLSLSVLSFTHTHTHNLTLYRLGSCYTEGGIVRKDLDRCMAIVATSVPPRLLIPKLAKGMPELMAAGHNVAR